MKQKTVQFYFNTQNKANYNPTILKYSLNLTTCYYNYYNLNVVRTIKTIATKNINTYKVFH